MPKKHYVVNPTEAEGGTVPKTFSLSEFKMACDICNNPQTIREFLELMGPAHDGDKDMSILDVWYSSMLTLFGKPNIQECPSKMMAYHVRRWDGKEWLEERHINEPDWLERFAAACHYTHVDTVKGMKDMLDSLVRAADAVAQVAVIQVVIPDNQKVGHA